MNKEVLKKLKLRLVIGWCALMFVCTLSYLFYLRPVQVKVINTTAQLQEKDTVYKKLLAAESKEKKIEILQYLQKIDNKLNNYVTELDDRGQLIMTLNQVAVRTGINKQFEIRSGETGKRNSGFNKIKNCPPLGDNTFNVNFYGTYVDAMAFINLIEKQQPLFFIDKFTLISDGEVVDVTMALTTLLRVTPLNHELRDELMTLHKEKIKKTVNNIQRTLNNDKSTESL